MRMLRCVMLALALGAAWAAPWASPVTARQAQAVDITAARATIVDLEDALLDLMRSGESTNFEERFERIDPVVRRTIDLRYIARVALGEYDGTLSEQDAERYFSAFARLSIANYAANFASYNEQRFTPETPVPLSGDRALVRSQMTRKKGEPVRFDYLLRLNEERQWRITNIVANGVSDLALKRTEFTSVLQNGGIEALLSEIERKIETLRTTPKPA